MTPLARGKDWAARRNRPVPVLAPRVGSRLPGSGRRGVEGGRAQFAAGGISVTRRVEVPLLTQWAYHRPSVPSEPAWGAPVE